MAPIFVLGALSSEAPRSHEIAAHTGDHNNVNLIYAKGRRVQAVSKASFSSRINNKFDQLQSKSANAAV